MESPVLLILVVLVQDSGVLIDAVGIGGDTVRRSGDTFSLVANNWEPFHASKRSAAAVPAARFGGILLALPLWLALNAL